MTEPASAIKRELEELIQMQIGLLRRERALSIHEISEYQDRAARIKSLTAELDRHQPLPSYTISERRVRNPLRTL